MVKTREVIVGFPVVEIREVNYSLLWPEKLNGVKLISHGLPVK